MAHDSLAERRAGYWEAMSIVSSVLERQEYRDSDKPQALEALYDVRAALLDETFSKRMLAPSASRRFG
ncbi:hypothetical protein SAMN05428963_11613 [Consotaella salsifontis]|uniref:Uncharacterized protein n=2 Tax=Consotaella salsifontis TaxID=1365950 RepID=A0A1T4SYT5_9HYPH|nr:hypothetical protein SAMN05428963_11613 [Consotaella salsifontis]